MRKNKAHETNLLLSYLHTLSSPSLCSQARWYCRLPVTHPLASFKVILLLRGKYNQYHTQATGSGPKRWGRSVPVIHRFIIDSYWDLLREVMWQTCDFKIRLFWLITDSCVKPVTLSPDSGNDMNTTDSSPDLLNTNHRGKVQSRWLRKQSVIQFCFG